MKLVVLGASGGVGRHVVSGAAERGHDVVAVVRRLDALSAPPSVRVVEADVLDPEALASIVSGRDAVVSCLGIRRAVPANPWSRLTSPPDFVERATRAIVAAMNRAGVRRLVTISAAGVADSADRMSPLLRVLFGASNVGVAYRDLANAERVLADAALDWLAVRPVTLTDASRSERVDVVSTYGLFASIARRSVAEWMLDRACDAAPFETRTPMIAGAQREA